MRMKQDNGHGAEQCTEATAVGHRLLAALATVDRPGSFCVEGALPPVLPGLEIPGMEPIGLPLTSTQALELAQRCSAAPYGKGEQTILDTSVRRVLELDPERFSLTNPDWPELVAKAAEQVRREFGLEKQRLSSHLYKLLLYEPGSFFLPHRDGERLDRMVATLVMVFPSAHEGGELVVRHDDQERVLDFSDPEKLFGIHFGAFYADCEHEIRPLRSGYRLCLVYNLTLEQAPNAADDILAPRSSGPIAAVRQVLESSFPSGTPTKLAVTLDHQYTQQGLVFDALKGVDRARAGVLFEAARQAGWRAHLALLTLWQSGQADGAEPEYRSWSRRHAQHGGEYEMGEVYDSTLTLDYWSDRNGERLPFGEMRIDEREIVSGSDLTDAEPDEEDFQGYTGNAGMSLERWYRYAAVVLWRQSEHFDILVSAGPERAVAALGRMTRERSRGSAEERSQHRIHCIDFASKILSGWPERRGGYRSREEPVAVLPLLVDLREPSLVETYLREVLPKDPFQDPGSDLVKACRKTGWSPHAEALGLLFDATTNETIERNVRLLESLNTAPDGSEERRRLCATLSDRALAALERWDATRGRSPVDRIELLITLVRSLASLEDHPRLGRCVEHVIAHAENYDVAAVQIPALLKLRPWFETRLTKPGAPVMRWLRHCRGDLEARAAAKPREPTDWRRAAELSCACEDCKDLAGFLEDRREKVYRFKVRQDRRGHLHQMIERHQCDLRHETERRGSPQTLVCTKTSASYQRRLEEHELACAQLSTIRTMESALS
jgi:hypothetical protein